MKINLLAGVIAVMPRQKKSSVMPTYAWSKYLSSEFAVVKGDVPPWITPKGKNRAETLEGTEHAARIETRTSVGYASTALN